MVENKEPIEEPKKSFLDEVREERAKLEEVKAEIQRDLQEFRDLKAQELLSGKSTAGNKPEPKKEISNKDYAKQALSGDLNNAN